MRLCASCLFISRKEIFFTHQSIPHSGNDDKAFIGCSEGRSTCIRLDAIRTERSFLKEKRTPEQEDRYLTLHGWYERIFSPAFESIRAAAEESRSASAERDALGRDSEGLKR